MHTCIVQMVQYRLGEYRCVLISSTQTHTHTHTCIHKGSLCLLNTLYHIGINTQQRLHNTPSDWGTRIRKEVGHATIRRDQVGGAIDGWSVITSLRTVVARRTRHARLSLSKLVSHAVSKWLAHSQITSKAHRGMDRTGIIQTIEWLLLVVPGGKWWPKKTVPNIQISVPRHF